MLSKTPKDCFLCFSKLKNIKYSIWQYVKFTYTEQFLLIRRNAFLLKELQDKAKPGENVVLDTDDYLDPEYARKAWKTGITMDFMVMHVGGTEYNATESINSSIQSHDYMEFFRSLGEDSGPKIDKENDEFMLL